jgi:class 3 adenylate cyclase
MFMQRLLEQPHRTFSDFWGISLCVHDSSFSTFGVSGKPGAVHIERYGGFVARYMGDGVLAYFGYPQAHEDDAERAVQAGLTLVESIPMLETPTQVSVRIGIATGPVVVGDLIGEGASQESAVVGETPNLAARLQTEAEENQVVIAEVTQRLVDGLFELGTLGVRELKGFSKGQALWAVRGRGWP